MRLRATRPRLTRHAADASRWATLMRKSIMCRRRLFLSAAALSLTSVLLGCVGDPTPASPTADDESLAASAPFPLTTTLATSSYGPDVQSTASLSVTPASPAGEWPAMVVGVASSRFGLSPLDECREEATAGWIAAIRVPFTGLQVLAKDGQTGFYEPMWSPNGEWISYVQVERVDPHQRVVDDQLIFDYPGSDSLWMIRPDGSEARQITDRYQRQERISTHPNGESCAVIGGILDAYGWSADSHWILFNNAQEGISEAITAVNVDTSESVVLASTGYGASWAPTTSTVATLSRWRVGAAYQYVEIENVTHPGLAPDRVILPFATDDRIATDVKWDPGEDGFSVFSVKAQGQSSASIIWHYDRLSARWERVGDFPGSVVEYIPDQRIVVGCSEDTIRVESIDVGVMISEISMADRIRCNDVWWMTDEFNRHVIGFQTQDPRLLWVSTIEEPVARVLIDLDQIGVDFRLGISGMSWRPTSK